MNKVKQIFSDISEDQIKAHKRLINSKAIQLIPNYIWRQELGAIATNLIYYFSGLSNEYDLNKSIALTGSFGVGKTMLMRIIQSYLQELGGIKGHPNIFRIVSIEDVIKSMSSTDYTDCELIYNQKIELDRPVKRPANILINEFGYKYNGKSFGTEYQELIEMFLMKRYDIYQEYGKLTHVTMNYDTDDLIEVFPEKIIERFKEMFNIIPVYGESFRK